VVRGVRGGNRRVTRCDIIRIMGWDRLIEYLGDVWEELWDAMLLKLKAAEATCHRIEGPLLMVRIHVEGGGEGRIRMLAN
jgi:hypothetical protein